MLLGIAEEEEITPEVRGWFGWGGEGDVELSAPSEVSSVKFGVMLLLIHQNERSEYFTTLLSQIQLPPSAWPDALPRRPRVLENLPLAAPLPPREQTMVEKEAERERNKNARDMMVLSFAGLVGDSFKRYKRMVELIRVSDEDGD